MKKKHFFVIVLILNLLFLNGCVSGEVLNPGDVIFISETRRYLTFTPEEDFKWWESEEATENPSISDLEENGMPFNSYYKIIFGFKEDAKAIKITCMKFDIIALNDCLINLVIRDENNRLKEPIFSREFYLTAHKSESIIIADFVFDKNSVLAFYNECPENVSIFDYTGFTTNWHIEYLELVGEY